MKSKSVPAYVRAPGSPNAYIDIRRVPPGSDLAVKVLAIEIAELHLNPFAQASPSFLDSISRIRQIADFLNLREPAEDEIAHLLERK